jgi:hypothetical protein
MPSTTKRPAQDLERRLTESAQAVRGFYASYVDEVEARDRLILAGSNAGYPHGRLAAWAGITPGRLNQIIARRAVEIEPDELAPVS